MAPLTFGFLGFIFGIIALFGVRRNGATGILGKVHVGFWIFILVGIGASQHFHEALVEISWQPPTILAQKIAKADHVVISREGESSVHKTDPEATKIVKAVSSARRDARNYNALFGVHIEFYTETNLLAAIRWQGHAFLTNEGQFRDNSGELNLIYRKLFIQ